MMTSPFWLIIATAILDLTFTGLNWKRLRFLTKPGMMLALIAWFTQVGQWQGELLWFGLGLTFGLIGDIMLLLPRRFFVGGLIAFLIGHVFYIFGFDLAPLPIRWGTLLALALIVSLGYFLFRTLRAGLITRPGLEKLMVPFQVYWLLLSLMFFTAILTLMRPDVWPLRAAVFAAIGAFSFYISDALLVYHRFVTPIRCGNLIVMITYYIAQFSITSAALLAYAR